jgi:hypothetical protein
VYKRQDVVFPEESTEVMMDRHGVEQDRLDSMTEAEALEPVIVGQWHDGTSILIDGNHRRVYWAQRGKHELEGWLLPERVWRMFAFDFDTSGGIEIPSKYLPQRMGKKL